MEKFTAFLEVIDGYVWGIPLIVLIMGTGILLSVRMGFSSSGNLGKALKYMVITRKTVLEKSPVLEH